MECMSEILLGIRYRRKDVDILKKYALENKEAINKLTATTSSDKSSVKISESQQQVEDSLQKLDDFFNCLENRLSEIEDSIKGNQRDKEDMKALREELKSKEKELDLKIAQLKLDLQNLKREVEVLEGEKRILELGQVTWLFEKYVATFVLPETEKVGFLGCFKHMNKWLGKNDHTLKGQKSRKIWKDLQSNSQVTWSADHFDAIKDLKEGRKSLAHPPNVNLTQARKEVGIAIPNLEDECLDIINMVEKLNSLMVLGQLASTFEDSVINVVYPGAKMNIAGLIVWLGLHGGSKRGREQRAQWSKLTAEIKWTKKHKEALNKMKLLKRNIKREELQDVEFEEAKKHMIDYVPTELEQECLEIVDMMKKIEILKPKSTPS